jgi:hypothetical protein
MSRPEGPGSKQAPAAKMSGVAGHFRWKAELSRAMAAQAGSRAERREWADLARNWDELADLLEGFVAQARKDP